MSKAKQTKTNRPMAGVVIQPDAGNDGSALAALSRQAEIIAILKSEMEGWKGYRCNCPGGAADGGVVAIDIAIRKIQRMFPDETSAAGRPG